jgi:hypothetical protein
LKHELPHLVLLLSHKGESWLSLFLYARMHLHRATFAAATLAAATLAAAAAAAAAAH